MDVIRYGSDHPRDISAPSFRTASPVSGGRGDVKNHSIKADHTGNNCLHFHVLSLFQDQSSQSERKSINQSC